MSTELHWLLWAAPKRRDTGAVAPGGFWTGADDRTFTVDGQERTYAGAGSLLGIGNLPSEKGSNAMQYSVTLSITDPLVEQAIRVCEPRLAPAELHLVEIDHETGAVLSIEREIKGRLNGASIEESAGTVRDPKITAVCKLSIFSSAMDGVAPLELKKSDASQRRVDPNDAGRQYADVSGVVPVVWMADSENPFELRD